MGAWIETQLGTLELLDNPVAPRVGAWIETVTKGKDDGTTTVAPRVGAWIETRMRERFRRKFGSHPVWVRGLKRMKQYYNFYFVPSHPVWVRGLKLRTKLCIGVRLVAPRVGAWIETKCGEILPCFIQVAPRVGAWIETDLAAAKHPS